MKANNASSPSLEPDSKVAFETRRASQTEGVKSLSDCVSELMKAGYGLVKRGKHLEAVGKYGQAIGLWPENPRICILYFDKAVAEINMGRCYEALADLKEAKAAGYAGPKLHFQKGRAYLHRKVKDAHLFWAPDAGSFKAAMDCAGMNPALLMPEHLNAIGNLKEGKELFLNLAGKPYVVRREKGGMNMYDNKNGIDVRHGFARRAIENFDRAEKEGFTDPYLLFFRARAYLALEDFDGAMGDIKRLLPPEGETGKSLNKPAKWGYFMRGRCKLSVYDFEGAISDFSEAEKYEYTNPFLHCEKAKAIRSLGRYGEAKSEFRKAIWLGHPNPMLPRSIAELDKILDEKKQA